jgi:hypothetical protein
MKTPQMEIAIAHHFGFRQNIIVPNICWGLGVHECDLLVIRKSGYALEVEIKVSISDLKQDAKKQHEHKSNKIKELYFAIPEQMKSAIEYIPERAGILLVEEPARVHILREARVNPLARKLTEQEITKVLHLGCMRIWTLKTNLFNARKKI